jgi:hypothetical protein
MVDVNVQVAMRFGEMLLDRVTYDFERDTYLVVVQMWDGPMNVDLFCLNLLLSNVQIREFLHSLLSKIAQEEMWQNNTRKYGLLKTDIVYMLQHFND